MACDKVIIVSRRKKKVPVLRLVFSVTRLILKGVLVTKITYQTVCWNRSITNVHTQANGNNLFCLPSWRLVSWNSSH